LIIVDAIIVLIVLLGIIFSIVGTNRGGKIECPYCKKMIIAQYLKLSRDFNVVVHEFECPSCRK